MKGYKEPRGFTSDGAPRWRLRLHLGTRADGKRDTYSETFIGSRREADQRLGALIAQADGLVAKRRQRTFGQLVEEWRTLVAPKRAHATVRSYEGNLRVHVLPRFGEEPVARIKVHDLERFYGELEAAGLKPATVHQVHSVISALLTAAVRWEWIDTNPARSTERSPIKWQPPRITDATAAELVRVLDAVAEEYQVALHLAAATGARRGELVGLRWSDLDLEAGTVRIERAIGHRKGAGCYVKDTKTHAVRTVAVGPDTLELVREYRSAAEKRAADAGDALGPHAYLFTDDPAGRTPWHPDRVSAAWVRACKVAKVKGLRLHDLRHYHATLALELSGDLAATRDRLGHRDISTTNRYVHARTAADRAIAEATGAYLARRSG